MARVTRCILIQWILYRGEDTGERTPRGLVSYVHTYVKRLPQIKKQTPRRRERTQSQSSQSSTVPKLKAKLDLHGCWRVFFLVQQLKNSASASPVSCWCPGHARCSGAPRGERAAAVRRRPPVQELAQAQRGVRQHDELEQERQVLHARRVQHLAPGETRQPTREQ